MPARVDENPGESADGLSRRDLLQRAAGIAVAAALPASFLARPLSAAAGTLAAPKPHGTLNWFGVVGDDIVPHSPTLKSWLSRNGIDFQTQFGAGPPLPAMLNEFTSGAAKGVDIFDVYPTFIGPLNEAGGIAQFMQPLDPSKIPNMANYLPGISGKKLHPWFSGGRQYTVPINVEPNSLVWSSARVAQAPTSWIDLTGPKFKGRLAFVTSPNVTYSLMTVLMNQVNGANRPYMPVGRLDEAIGIVKRLVANSKLVTGSNGDAVNALASGEVDAIFNGYPELAVFANAANPATKAAYQLFPKDGNVIAVVAWGIGAQADNVDTAYAMINQTLSPKVQAEFNNAIVAGPVVSGVDKLLKPTVRSIFGSKNVSTLLKRFPQVVVPPLASDKYVTRGDWSKAYAAVTG